MKESDADHVVECDIQILRLRAEIRRVQTLRNSYLPISRLPTEILCKVFACVRDMPETRSFPATPHVNILRAWVKSITHVCHHWRLAALNCPELWSYLEFNKDPPSWMELQLKRSRKAPLSVIFISPQGDRCEKVLLSALSQPSRLHSLSILGATSDTIEKYMKTVRRVHAPFLQRLQVIEKFQEGIWYSPRNMSRKQLPPDIFSGGTPSLREVEIYGNPVPFTSLIFKDLCILKLKTPPSALVSLPDFIDALHRSPNLKELDVHFSIRQTLSYSPKPRSIILPHVERLHLEATLPNCQAILKHLSLPISAKLGIELIDINVVADLPIDPEAYSDTKSLMSAIEQAWMSEPLASNSATDKGALAIRSLDYDLNSDEDSFSIRVWLDSRQLTSLHSFNLNSDNAPLEIFSQGFSSPIEHSPEVFKELALDHLESACIRTVSPLVWHSFMMLPSLTSLGVDGTSAATFFSLVLEDNLLRSNNATLVHPTLQPPAKNKKICAPSIRFPNLVNLSFSEVDFGHSSYGYTTPGTCEQVPIDFGDDFIEYLNLRRGHHTPIERVHFKSCINFTTAYHKEVLGMVKDVEWDGKVDVRHYTHLSDEDDLRCQYCGQNDDGECVALKCIFF
ncbi:hypothetical protein BJ165DRAFT_1608541 [Panaeolus papilionaceus]|nr:hypothetical protein BJ165DRAFT_1608541 [Panaeolus papilionaceus]